MLLRESREANIVYPNTVLCWEMERIEILMGHAQGILFVTILADSVEPQTWKLGQLLLLGSQSPGLADGVEVEVVGHIAYTIQDKIHDIFREVGPSATVCDFAHDLVPKRECNLREQDGTSTI